MHPQKVFAISGKDSLQRIYESGLIGYSSNRIQYPTHTSTSCIWLFLSDATILRISSQMHDLEGWDEVSSLVSEVDVPRETIPSPIPLPIEWRGIVAIEKLVVRDGNYFAAESGIKITCASGQVAIICSAASPFELTLAAPFFEDDFSPEYDIERYEMAPL